MKKEMKIVLPFYKIAYAVSFVVILSVIRAVVFTYEIGLSHLLDKQQLRH